MPKNIAPYEVIVLPVNVKDEESFAKAGEIYQALNARESMPSLMTVMNGLVSNSRMPTSSVIPSASWLPQDFAAGRHGSQGSLYR